jgi:hypothetical protein
VQAIDGRTAGKFWRVEIIGPIVATNDNMGSLVAFASKRAVQKNTNFRPRLIPAQTVYDVLLSVAGSRGFTGAQAEKNIEEFFSRGDVDAVDYILLGLNYENATDRIPASTVG